LHGATFGSDDDAQSPPAGGLVAGVGRVPRTRRL